MMKRSEKVQDSSELMIIGSVDVEVINKMQWDLYQGTMSIGQQVDKLLASMDKDDKVRRVVVNLDEERN
jgi:hypothetical protein